MSAQSPSSDDKKSSKIHKFGTHLAWKQKTATRLIASGSTMIDLASKEKKSTRVFHVHKALLCFYSPYHDKLLNGYFVEGTIPCQQPIVQEVRAEILRLFFTWLYSGNVDLTLPKLDGSNTSYYWMIVTKFYIFADSINCVALQRSIMSFQPMHISKECKTLPPPPAIELLSATALESSHLYQYMVDCYQSHWDGVWQDDDQAEDEIDEKAKIVVWQDDEQAEQKIDEKAKNGDPLPPNFAYRILVRGLAVKKEQKHDGCRCCYDRCFYHGHSIWDSEERGARCNSREDALEEDQEEDPSVDTDTEFDTDTEYDTETDSVTDDAESKSVTDFDIDMTHDFGSDSENDADFDGDPDLPGDSETVVEENKKEEKKKKKKRRGKKNKGATANTKRVKITC
ncbi:hypothetical protein D6D29_05312 [Aureobasidium pullulans]|nr:hypothetical protein D6D29_05312 [Aureobasidium pullulans]TIA70529.1 hypothetical protein D6C76_07485 [Aureobasidium pullulans]